ncbi:MAG: class I SAM-dependent methyltransferase [Bryobacterales bacterium]|nr:class I SAM-dependent methyltransferase [Bryobacterales bacterium]
MLRFRLAALLCSFLPLYAQHGDHKKHMDKGADHMQHRFENPEQWAKSFDDPKRDAWQMPDKVIAALGLKPGMSVADIGAGTGYFTIRLAKSEAKPTVVASDIEAGMLAHIAKRAAAEHLANVKTAQANEASPNLPEPMDVILMVNTIHHIPNRNAYFSKLASSLKPGGRLAIVDYKPGAPSGPPEHFRFTVEKMTAELGAAGYKVQAQYNFLPNQNYLIFVRK